MLAAYDRIFERHRPYAVATRALRSRLNGAPLGHPIQDVDWFDPIEMASRPFLDLVHRLDVLTFGPLGITMPRWALYDCAQLPGVVFGLGSPASHLKPRARRALEVPDDYEGLVPLSMYIAIPTLDAECWLGHSICALNEVSPGVSPPGMRLVTMALGVMGLGVQTIVGTTQWSSSKLAVHAQFAPLRVQAAWMPAHSEPDSCVFYFPVTEARVQNALRVDRPPPHCDFHIDTGRDEALLALQIELEAGQEIFIAGPPVARGSVREIPMVRGHR